MDEKEFKKLVKEHDDVLQSAENINKKLLTEKQIKAFKIIQEEFLDKLERDENGNVKMNSKNIELLNGIDKIFIQLSKQSNIDFLKSITLNISSIINYNSNYYSAIDGKAKVLKILPKVTNAMSAWLGIKDGVAQKNGFIDQLISNDSAKVAVKNLAMKIVIGQQGLEGAKKDLQTLIEGNKNSLGAF